MTTPHKREQMGSRPGESEVDMRHAADWGRAKLAIIGGPLSRCMSSATPRVPLDASQVSKLHCLSNPFIGSTSWASTHSRLSLRQDLVALDLLAHVNSLDASSQSLIDWVIAASRQLQVCPYDAHCTFSTLSCCKQAGICKK